MTTMMERRPPAMITTIAVLGFLGLSAVAGGILLLGPWADDLFPSDWLDLFPLIDSWLIPGLVLGIGFGLGSLVTACGMFARLRWSMLRPVERWTGHHWSWAATFLLGIGQVIWIGLELIYMPGQSWLHALYGGVGIALTLLPFTPQVRRQLSVKKVVEAG
ncbi:hypothetical protein [Acrocarpospora catenulata]|uniref:hypothetical protein n=1 Tax=Acrocarpospora catenulata TaxID=2836182 RepID=UPI001BDB4C29|nr:hypothetical protein [Acrocarpospora catenulata]